tara:strand:+ start:1703 stop:1912 length:210 start_codon:yes stop_codon:yes gene_type:complete
MTRLVLIPERPVLFLQNRLIINYYQSYKISSIMKKRLTILSVFMTMFFAITLTASVGVCEDIFNYCWDE